MELPKKSNLGVTVQTVTLHSVQITLRLRHGVVRDAP